MFYPFLPPVLLIFIILGLMLWRNAMRAKEIAIRVSRASCEKRNLQFLDDTVAVKKIRLKRNDIGQCQIYREYQFEYFIEAESIRRTCLLILLGDDVIEIIGFQNETYDNIIQFPHK